MTMDFDPPRAERPARGILFGLLAIPLGALGFWLGSWSAVLDAAIIAFAAFMQVLLYRRGSRSRVIVKGRVPLLVVGVASVFLSISIGYSISAARLSQGVSLQYLSNPNIALGIQPATLFFSAVAGIFALVFFVRRFSVEPPLA